jgi:glycerophosphoryl diester phosphodiesterase
MFTAMRSTSVLTVFVAVALVGAAVVTGQAPAKQAIAHRGASGYAPEHTMAAYALAIEQKADFVEQDLGVSKDGVLVCLHDDTLERTSNVEAVFPDRAGVMPGAAAGAGGRAGADRKRWLINDFTVAEMRRLDFGSWFNPKFANARIVTFQEAIDFVRTKPGVGMYPELKSPPLYTSRGVDMTKIFVDQVKKNGLDRPESLRAHPVIIQSFDEATIRRVSKELPTIPRGFLTSNESDVTDARLRELATFATGIMPEKRIIAAHPDMVARAHAAGLTVTSWTFAVGNTPGYPTVKDEMSHFLYDLGIDALFTNNPDQFPHTR